MKAEAEANAEEDRKAKERIDKLNAADALIFQTEKQLKEYGEKLPADKKSEIESGLEALRNAHKSQDISSIDAAMEKLNAAWQKASEDMYKSAQGAAPGSQTPPPNAGDDTGSAGNNGGGSDDEVTDVDFEEVDDK